MIDVELARQSAQLMAARSAAWQRFMRVVHAGPPVSIDTPACDHDVDLLGKCRRCGAEAGRA